MFYSRYAKRFIDFGIALVAFIFLLPVFVLLTIWLLVANRGKAFFLQPRPGKDKRIFRVIKFKTMNDRRDSAGRLLPDADRLTPLGSFIRKTSLDELPQLLNVVLGDMSLIGPRPLLVDYLELYDSDQQKRHQVRPGITGWAQVNGRNAISWEQKFNYDVWYVDNASLSLDAKILWMTALKVIKTEGISSATSVTMEKFTGS